MHKRPVAELFCICIALLSGTGTAVAQPGEPEPEPEPARASTAEDGAPRNSSRWSGFFSASSTIRSIATDTNPDNASGVPRQSVEAATILDYKKDELSVRIRAAALYRNIPYATDRRSDWSLEATQLAWRLPIDPSWVLLLGRTNLMLDDGQSFHPFDFFEDNLRGTDFEDRLGLSRGFPMVMMENADAAGSLRIALSDDRVTHTEYVYGDANPGFNRGARQALVAVRRSFGQLSVGGVAQRYWPGSAGFGANFSWVPDAAISLYGAGFLSRNNSLPLHKNVYLGRGTGLGESDVYLQESPVRAWAEDDGNVYARWLAGAGWTSESGSTFVTELWRDERGMSHRQFIVWQQVATFHDQLSNPVARRINLGYDLKALRVPSGTQLFMRYTSDLPAGYALQVSNLLAQDGSGSLATRVTRRSTDRMDWSLEAWQRHGGRYSRYGSVPDQRGLSLQARYFF